MYSQEIFSVNIISEHGKRVLTSSSSSKMELHFSSSQDLARCSWASFGRKRRTPGSLRGSSSSRWLTSTARGSASRTLSEPWACCAGFGGEPAGGGALHHSEGPLGVSSPADTGPEGYKVPAGGG